MRTFFLLLITALCAFGQTKNESPFYVPFAFKSGSVPADLIFSDVYVDFETSTDNTIVTTAIGTNSSHGAYKGDWALSGAITGMRISTGAERALPNNVIALDVTYTDSGSTRGILMTNNVDTEYMRHNFGANKTKAAVGFWILSTFDGSGVSINPIDISGGGSLAALSISDSGTPEFAIETDSGDGTHIGVSASTWYWCWLEYNQNSTCTLKVYDTAGAVVGTSSNTTGNNPCNLVRFGRVDAHSASHPPTYFKMDDLLIRSDTGYSPVGPAVDTNAWFPTISLLASNAPLTTSATITWATMNAYGSSVVEYSTDSSYGSSATGSDATNHSVAVSGLTLSTTYNFHVYTIASGKKTQSSNFSFTTPATDCATYASQATDNDNFSNGSTTWAQYIHNVEGTAKTICRVTCTFKSTTGAQTVTCGIWSSPNEAGTQLGANSTATAITTATAAYDFTWASNPVTGTTNFYLVFKNSGGSSEINFEADTIALGTGYENTTYCAFRGTTAVTLGTVDLVFDLRTTP